MPTAHLIIDEPSPGAWNMAVDEALLDWAAEKGVCSLRFYRWREPTLSLGYFQEHADRQRHEPRLTLPVVRRSTGGGALVHDQELTYSLALPPGHPRAANTTELTCLAHKALREAVAEIGGEASRLTTCAQAIPAANGCEPFLCFERRAEGDLLSADGEHKLCGSAQRRRRGALLQHGGLILRKSRAAPELSGAIELGVLPESAGVSALAGAWAQRIAGGLGLLALAGAGYAARMAADLLTKQRFLSPHWTRRR